MQTLASQRVRLAYLKATSRYSPILLRSFLQNTFHLKRGGDCLPSLSPFSKEEHLGPFLAEYWLEMLRKEALSLIILCEVHSISFMKTAVRGNAGNQENYDSSDEGI